MKILLVEDDEPIAEMLRTALTAQHYIVECASDGQTGWELAEAFEYDLILLDLMLPKLDGISFCKRRRQKGDRTPILLLTAQDSGTNKVKGLDAGADDYVAKPFDLQELLARIRALLRRGTATATPILEWENLRFDPSNCEVIYNGQALRLTAKEYALLELFLRHTHRIFSQSALLDHLWSFEEPPSENTVRAHIKSLRQKLKKAGAPADFIETVYGLGYRLKSIEPEAKRPEKARVIGAVVPSQPQNQLDEEDSSPSTIEPLELPVPPELTAIWDRFKGKYSDRITVLEQAVTALLEDSLSEELRQQAAKEAHTLVGSLGSFGFTEASRRSREFEQAMQTADRLSATQKHDLSELVLAIRRDLGQTPVILTPTSPKPHSVNPQLRLLVVDDDAPLALALASEAATWGMQSEVAGNLSQAREAIARNRPDVVLLDLCFPDSAENGLELLAELTTCRLPMPVLVFTAQESFADRVKVARLGGRGFLQKPISPAQVMEAIAQVLQPSGSPEARLLIVDDDPHLLDFLRILLEPWGFKLTLLDDPKQFWNTLEQSVPDLLILDVEMPELNGIDLCQVVRNDPNWSELPVLFLSAHTDAQTLQQVFMAGADDYVSKPIVGPELVARILNRLERTRIVRQLRTLRS